ncbi:hypothetical protein LguiB_027601 [Lonicera macranthoides]
MERRGGVDGRENYTSISIDALVTSFRNKMEELLEIPPECCIYKVAVRRMMSNKEVYMPHVVSIGPFHYNNKELQGMEEYKLRYMKVFLSRTDKNLDDFISVMMGMEKRARNCYSEKIDCSVDEFLKILIVDSFFILEAMIGEVGIDPLDQAFYLPNQVSHFKTDLVLLKNQIPFFVLNNFFQSAFHGCPPTRFLEFCVNYMASSIIPIKDSGKLLRKVKEYLNLGHKIKHSIDLLRIFYLPSALRTTSANVDELISIPNAVQLQEAGVKLLKVGSSDSLIDIKFTKGVLEIPVLIVQDYFELLMSNILIFESCHYACETYIGNYVFFMQMLINTDKDVDLLIHNGIIKNLLGKSLFVADLLNKVRREAWIWIPSYYLYDISKSLNAYCNISRHKWKATFKRDYCSTPWMIASTTAAIILLTLTFLSTVTSFLAL